MPGTPTTKYAIPTLAGTTLARDIDTETNAGLTAIDSKMVGFSAGALGSLPTSSPGTPGIAGRRYRATDGVNAGRLFEDTGTGWVEVVADPPRIRLIKDGQSIPVSTDTNVTWNYDNVVGTFDPKNLWGPAPSASVTIQVAGVYLINVVVRWQALGTGARRIALRVNGTDQSFDMRDQASGGSEVFNRITSLLSLAAGDVIVVNAFQNHSAAVLVSGTTSVFEAVRVA